MIIKKLFGSIVFAETELRRWFVLMRFAGDARWRNVIVGWNEGPLWKSWAVTVDLIIIVSSAQHPRIRPNFCPLFSPLLSLSLSLFVPFLPPFYSIIFYICVDRFSCIFDVIFSQEKRLICIKRYA